MTGDQYPRSTEDEYGHDPHPAGDGVVHQQREDCPLCGWLWAWERPLWTYADHWNETHRKPKYDSGIGYGRRR